jgi:hypothetical protein
LGDFRVGMLPKHTQFPGSWVGTEHYLKITLASGRPYLMGEGKARSVSLATDSFTAIEKQFPYVVTAGVKNDKINYPSEILARHLYLARRLLN